MRCICGDAHARVNCTYLLRKLMQQTHAIANDCSLFVMIVRIKGRDVQESEPEQEPELSKFFRSRIGLVVKFNVKTGVGVGAGVTIFKSYYCNVN